MSTNTSKSSSFEGGEMGCNAALESFETSRGSQLCGKSNVSLEGIHKNRLPLGP